MDDLESYAGPRFDGGGRRAVLRSAAAAVATLGLAACTPFKSKSEQERRLTTPRAPRSAMGGSSTVDEKAPVAPTAPPVTISAKAPAGVRGVARQIGHSPSAALPVLKAVSPAGETAPTLPSSDPVWHLLRRSTFGPTRFFKVEGDRIPRH